MSSLRRKYSSTHSPTFYRHGAEEARGAHNSEDTRSKRVVGIFIHSHRCIKALRALSKNTQDQQNTYRCSSAAERLKTSFAIFLTLTSPFCEWLSPYKRKVTGSKPVAGNIFNLPVLQKRVVKLDAINAAPTKVGSFYRHGAEVSARGS